MGWTPCPIGFTELAAWAALTGAEPTPAEVRILAAMDAVLLSEMAKRSKRG